MMREFQGDKRDRNNRTKIWEEKSEKYLALQEISAREPQMKSPGCSFRKMLRKVKVFWLVLGARMHGYGGVYFWLLFSN
jgi:hypothetical protein